MRKVLVVIALCFPPLIAAGDSDQFLVKMKVLENGAELATPEMIVEKGSEASMNISGEQALVAVGLIVNGHNENEAHVVAEIETSADRMSPELLVKKGQWASVSVGELEFHILVEDHAATE
ncbi:hypothetical protein G4Y73_12575 [Wenzhouxiangella sp. XN201]|uniref:hypothetical protein n=1 Tax=Wenzhouxiangella sp. XN201 TaxID=2710755 RepID=UPI0013C662E3|nr:hypothetical protein [Wenzhouxiangella sp. XN201]NEZ04985.1 hypothetical protein [Wenzhouxiangella sp. XN201]